MLIVTIPITLNVFNLVCLTERGVAKRNQNDILIKQPEAVKIPVSNSPSKNPKSAPISKAVSFLDEESITTIFLADKV